MFNFWYAEQYVWLAVCIINFTTFMMFYVNYYGKKRYFWRSIWRDQLFNIVVCVFSKVCDFDRVLNFGCMLLLVETNYVLMRVDRVAVMVNNANKSSMHVTARLENQIFNTNMGSLVLLVGYGCFLASDMYKFFVLTSHDNHSVEHEHERAAMKKMTEISQYVAPIVFLVVYSLMWYTVYRFVNTIGGFVRSKSHCKLCCMKLMPGLILCCIFICFMLVFENLRTFVTRVIDDYIDEENIKNGSLNLCTQYIIMLLLV